MKKIFSLFVMAVLLFVGGRLFAQDHEYVDLGLPSGTLWATCNIGANAPEESGDYFSWGETKTKRTYRWETYKYGADSYLKKYCDDSFLGYNGFTDNLTTLQPSDDAASANWGSEWLTPTKTQWKELLDNTTNKWTTQNGVEGRLFTSKKNDQSLFLPAADYRWDGEPHNEDSYGHYWSSSLDTGSLYNAWSLYFNVGGYRVTNNYTRGVGFTVRPVRSAR